MNVVTVAYLAVLHDGVGRSPAPTPPTRPWVPVADVLDGKVRLAFDHERIVPTRSSGCGVIWRRRVWRRRSSGPRSRCRSCGRCTRRYGTFASTERTSAVRSCRPRDGCCRLGGEHPRGRSGGSRLSCSGPAGVEGRRADQEAPPVGHTAGRWTMTLLDVDVPTWVLDWTGSVLVAVSLLFLFGKRIAYWHFSNASLIPYFALFLSGRQYMLAGLQASYLIFGLHGLALWRLERPTGHDGAAQFDEHVWYHAGWVLSLAIFGWTVGVTDFVGPAGRGGSSRSSPCRCWPTGRRRASGRGAGPCGWSSTCCRPSTSDTWTCGASWSCSSCCSPCRSRGGSCGIEPIARERRSSVRPHEHALVIEEVRSPAPRAPTPASGASRI